MSMLSLENSNSVSINMNQIIPPNNRSAAELRFLIDRKQLPIAISLSPEPEVGVETTDHQKTSSQSGEEKSSFSNSIFVGKIPPPPPNADRKRPSPIRIDNPKTAIDHQIAVSKSGPLNTSNPLYQLILLYLLL